MQKLLDWQEVEVAAMKARVTLGEMPQEDFDIIVAALKTHPPNVCWWKCRDGKIRHDLNAFLEERIRWIPKELQHWFHKGMTSYDTEEAALAKALKASLNLVLDAHYDLMGVLKKSTLKYRYTPMMADTHGQWADVQTFGKRQACWYKDLQTDYIVLSLLKPLLDYSKLSGFVGNYTNMDPAIEKVTLQNLGLEPYLGATQIVPKEVSAPTAFAIAQLSKTLQKIFLAIRLGARSGTCIYQEPFGKMQKGSSAAPQKRNTILSERGGGLDNMIEGYLGMLLRNIVTWEERSIEHSCVERVAWPDMFHAIICSLETLTKVIRGLKVYPDKMMEEIVRTNGTYAASEAKDRLKELALSFGLSVESCYRIVQLAAFNLGYSSNQAVVPDSIDEADQLLQEAQNRPLDPMPRRSIRDVIRNGELVYCDQLAATSPTIRRWNQTLRRIFKSPEANRLWDEVFTLTYLLRNEPTIFYQVMMEK